MKTPVAHLFLFLTLSAPAVAQCISQTVPASSPNDTFFGLTVAARGEFAVVGSLENNTGVATFLRRDAGAWAVEQRTVGVEPSGGATNGHANNFGHIAQVSGSWAALANPNWGNPVAPFHGRVHMFERQVNGTWLQQDIVRRATQVAEDQFGRSVTIDGDTLAVGARIGTGATNGEVHLLERQGNQWLLSQTIVGSLNFGRNLTLHGDVLALTDVNDLFIYERTGGTWNLAYQVPFSVGGVAPTFATYLAMQDDLVVASSQSGDVEFFERGVGGWTPGQALPLGAAAILEPFGDDGFLAIPSSGLGSILRPQGGVWQVVGTVTGSGIFFRGAGFACADEQILVADIANGAVDIYSYARAEVVCTGASNSTGFMGELTFEGCASTAAPSGFEVSNLPANEFLIPVMGRDEVTLPLGSGVLCISPFLRYGIGQADAAGSASFALDTAVFPANQITAGSSWIFQAWHRDGGTSNLTTARRVNFVQ